MGNAVNEPVEMEYTYLGRSGMKVSRICLGTYSFGSRTSEKEAFYIMDAALDAGINFFDTANHYPDFVNCGLTEKIVGRWFALGGNRRERVVLATKVYQPMMDTLDGPNNEGGLSKYKIRRHIEGSLRRLNTDHIELYQMHHVDRRTTWDEIWEGLDILINQGKVGYAGSSNFPGWCLAVAQANANGRRSMGLVSEQHRYNLLCRLPELEVLPAARHLGIGVLAYSPLAEGLLVGRPPDALVGVRSAGLAHFVKRHYGQFADFEDLCKGLGRAGADVALAWVLLTPGVSCAVIGPRLKSQLDDSLRAIKLALDGETIKRLEEIFPGPGGAAPEAYAW